MKKRKILKLLITSIMISSIFSLNLLMPAVALGNYQDCSTPVFKCAVSQFLEKGDSSGVEEITTSVVHTGQQLEVRFINATYKLPDLEEDEIYFVVAIDSENKGPLKSEYLNCTEPGKYSCVLDLPYHCDVVDLHFYKQKKTDPAFTIKEKNFIGRKKMLMTHDAVFMRQEKKALTALDKDGNEITTNPLKADFVSRITPNYYSISCTDTRIADWSNIGRIVLPDGQKNLMTKDETVVPYSYLHVDKKPGEGETWKNAVTENTGFYNFHLPPEVTEFTFQIFKTNVSDKKEDIIAQFKIKLDK